MALIGRTSDNEKEQYLLNMAAKVRLAIYTFPSRFSPVVKHVAEGYHVAKSLYCISARRVVVFLSMLDLKPINCSR